MSGVLPRTVSANEFTEYIEQIHAIARNFKSEHDPNLLVLDFLRHKKYDDYRWAALVGGVDSGFIAAVERARIGLIQSFRDPDYGFDFEVAHFAAACTGIYVHGKPGGDGANRGDVAAWGGDWITFYGNWRSEHRKFPVGRAYCVAKLMKADVASAFGFSDLMADVDGYNIAMKLRAGAGISELVRATYGNGGHTPRIEPWFRGRFRDGDGARAAARDILVSWDDGLVALGRWALIDAAARGIALQPDMLDPEQLDDFCWGFVSGVQRNITQEHVLLNR